jgi:hypothetical protein
MFSQLAGYRLFVFYNGTQQGNRLYFDGNFVKFMQDELDAMATWYLINVIGQRLQEFERFRL